MDANALLCQITIPTPCRMDWNQMTGDDRTRLCASCGKQVYNIAAMTSDEAIDLIRARGGELCGQLFRRRDGTVVTSDCPPPALSPGRKRQFSIGGLMALIAGFGAMFGFAKLLVPEQVGSSVGAVRNYPGEISVPPAVLQAISKSAAASSGQRALAPSPDAADDGCVQIPTP